MNRLFLILPIIFVLLVSGCAQQTQNSQQISTMKLTSLAFENNGLIPAKYTCDGEDINPALKIEKVPPTAKSLVLIIDDPDAPVGTWVHGIAFNMDPDTTLIEERSGPKSGIAGKNSFGKNDYGGPCPPPSETHRYFFKLYALDKKLDLDNSATKADVEKAMENHILGKAELVGKYSKK